MKYSIILIALSSANVRGEEKPFLVQVQSHFAAWDADNDGKLTANEIELAVNNPKVKGEAAAAAASLRRGVKAKGIAAVTLDDLKNPKPDGPKYEAMYSAAFGRIQSVKRELFASELPKLEGLSQGRLGDCFLLASLGTIVHNDPARIKKLFTLLPDGKVKVNFAEPVIIDLPTDAEIAIGARNGNDGLWANAYEKAVGTVYLARQKSGKHVTPWNIIGVGGSPHSPLQLVTGRKCRRVGCEDFQNGKIAAADRDARLAEIRKALVETRQAGRLIVGGTAPLGGKQTVVPGLYYNHSYGVLDYDEKTDLVTFWNPFGNSYTPKGEPGLKHGYPTKHGVFRMPLSDAVMWFGSFSVETDEKVTPQK